MGTPPPSNNPMHTSQREAIPDGVKRSAVEYLQEAEMSVRRLLASLERQRSCFGLEGDLTDVLRTVQHLNSARQMGGPGPNHYFSSTYVRLA
jgi:hypothetical protein